MYPGSQASEGSLGDPLVSLGDLGNPPCQLPSALRAEWVHLLAPREWSRPSFRNHFQVIEKPANERQALCPLPLDLAGCVSTRRMWWD